MDQDPFSIWADPPPVAAQIGITEDSSSDSNSSPPSLSSTLDQDQHRSPSALAPSVHDGPKISSFPTANFGDDLDPWSRPTPTVSPEKPIKASSEHPAQASDSLSLKSLVLEEDISPSSPADLDLSSDGADVPGEAELEPGTSTQVDSRVDQCFGGTVEEDEEEDRQVSSTTTGDSRIVEGAPTTSDRDGTQEDDNFREDQGGESAFSNGEGEEEAPAQGGFGDDDFDDFHDPDQAGAEDGDEDEFGDFEDFEEAGPPTATGEPQAQAPPTLAVQETRAWEPLEVTADTVGQDLFEPISKLLPPLSDPSSLTGEELRQVEGPAQVLISEPSRQLWKELTSLPPVRPINWVRSSSRRDYLITLGVPIDLDEIHSSSGSGSVASSGGLKSALPPLKLKLDSNVGRSEGPNSAPVDGPNGMGGGSNSMKRSSSGSGGPGPSSGAGGVLGYKSSGNSPNRSGSPSGGAGGLSGNRERMAERRREELGLGKPPDVDLKRAEELVAKTEDQLSLQSLPALRSILKELQTLTTSTSSLLTHHLTLRESHMADSEMYNSMIKDLVAGAANRFSGGGGSNTSSRNAKRDDRRSTSMGLGYTSSSSSNSTNVQRLGRGGAGNYNSSGGNSNGVQSGVGNGMSYGNSPNSNAGIRLSSYGGPNRSSGPSNSLGVSNAGLRSLSSGSSGLTTGSVDGLARSASPGLRGGAGSVVGGSGNGLGSGFSSPRR
ncbi:hypothetical protein IE53DRAFT_359469 [Violaceomyces palustris]|uniref:Uncharacterized protein n=1 Tax=Violaceomyces palustris TaxID=1673888 RepID=A0ACD0P7G1_9BASI|nr:hypothetical protein IE53DRAFT_359469 [Violaceomyces palustris]